MLYTVIILNICRTTLYKYTKNGTIKFNILDNGYYDYDDKSIYSLKKKNKSIKIETIYSEIASGLDFDRTEFSLLLDDIFNYKIDTVFISNKDRLTRLSFNTLVNIFKKFDTIL